MHTYTYILRSTIVSLRDLTNHLHCYDTSQTITV